MCVLDVVAGWRWQQWGGTVVEATSAGWRRATLTQTHPWRYWGHFCPCLLPPCPSSVWADGMQKQVRHSVLLLLVSWVNWHGCHKCHRRTWKVVFDSMTIFPQCDQHMETCSCKSAARMTPELKEHECFVPSDLLVFNKKTCLCEHGLLEKNPLLHRGMEPVLAACRSNALPTELQPHPKMNTFFIVKFPWKKMGSKCFTIYTHTHMHSHIYMQTFYKVLR